MKKVLWLCIGLIALAAAAMYLPPLPVQPPRDTGFRPGFYPTPAHIEEGIRPATAVTEPPPPPGPKADPAVAATVLIRIAHPKGGRAQCGGFVVDRAEGLIVSSGHPFQKPGNLFVALPIVEKGFAVSNPGRYGPDKSLGGRVVMLDARRDLALLRVGALPPSVPELALASRPVAAGASVRLVGHPGDKNLVWDETVGKAGTTAPMHWTTAEGQRIRGHFLSVDAAEGGQLGCSGSPVIDGRLGVLGLVAAASGEAGSKTVFCVDASELRRFLSDAYLQLGWEAYRRGEYGRSATNFEKAQRNADRPCLALLGLGLAHLRQGNREPAATAFARALPLGWVDGPDAVGRTLALLWDAPDPQAWIHEIGGFFGLAPFGDDLLLRRSERAAETRQRTTP